jgi:2-polyprenyl-3-methyl-5-hydroxy-6-metoxy-1,4-benzoquinol methylase
MSLDLKDFYEKSAEIYNPEKQQKISKFRRFFSRDDRVEIMVAQLNKILLNSKGKKILDIGCGDGVYEKQLDGNLKKDNFFVGIDISETQLSRAKTIFNETHLVNFENNRIPLNDGEFDYIICSEVLEHLFYPDRVISEIKRLLKPGGIFFLTTPNISCFQNRMALLFWGDSPNFNYLQNKEHIRFYTKKTFIKLFGVDFSLIKQVGINSLLFEKYLFPIRIIIPYFLQKLANIIAPNFGGGLFLIFKKN